VQLRDLETDKVLSSKIHVDRLKLGQLKSEPIESSTESEEQAATASAEKETINPDASPVSSSDVENQDVLNDTVPVELILQQKGQGPSLRYRVKPCLNADGSRNQSYWIRADLVDQDLIDKFYEKHTKSGKIRKRVLVGMIYFMYLFSRFCRALYFYFCPDLCVIALMNECCLRRETRRYTYTCRYI